MATITRWYRSHRGALNPEPAKLAGGMARDRESIKIPFTRIEGDKVFHLDVTLTHEEARKLRDLLNTTLTAVAYYRPAQNVCQNPRGPSATPKGCGKPMPDGVAGLCADCRAIVPEPIRCKRCRSTDRVNAAGCVSNFHAENREESR